MSAHPSSSPVNDRVLELATTFARPDASAAAILCDRHDPARQAFRILGPDLSANDISYGELREQSERFGNALKSLGVRPGDRIATLMGKSREYLVALMGIWRLGAVHVPLFTAFAPPAIATRLLGSKARVVVCDEEQLAKLEPGDDIPGDADWSVITTGKAKGTALAFADLMLAAEPGLPAASLGGDAPLIHIYTSGTTGNPKGVVVPIRALASFQAYMEFGIGIDAEDTYWCAADPGWAYGLYYAVLGTLLTGAKSLLLKGGFSPEVTFKVLERERVTNFAAAPTVYRALRSSGLRPAKPLALRKLSSAGEPLTPEVNIWARDVFDLEVHDHYGQTETGMLINNHHHPLLRQPIAEKSMGQSMPGWSAVVLGNEADAEVPAGTPGRLAIRLTESPLAWFAGYDGDAAKSADKFSADGCYYLTGDTGMIDETGQYRFTSRDDDVIIMAGYRIGPFEVESAMLTHPAVVEAAVIAVPDEVRGEVIEAFVVLAEGHVPGAELEKDIQQWVKKRYAAHAFPRAVHFAASLPKTPSGKIQRFVLKQRRLSSSGAD